MKRFLSMVMLMLFSALAVADEGIYKEVCRSDDPFVYCTQGCKETKAWKPSTPYASIAYRPSVGYCPYPTTQCCDSYCVLRPWSQRDFNDYYQNRVYVCPAAHTDGKWIGGGRPDKVPVIH